MLQHPSLLLLPEPVTTPRPNKYASSIPRGDEDPERNQALARITTTQLFYPEVCSQLCCAGVSLVETLSFFMYTTLAPKADAVVPSPLPTLGCAGCNVRRGAFPSYSLFLLKPLLCSPD